MKRKTKKDKNGKKSIFEIPRSIKKNTSPATLLLHNNKVYSDNLSESRILTNFILLECFVANVFMMASRFNSKSRRIDSNANDVNRSCTIVLLKYVFNRRITDIERSHSHDVTGTVASIFKQLYIIGNVFFLSSFSNIFNTSAIDAHLASNSDVNASNQY